MTSWELMPGVRVTSQIVRTAQDDVAIQIVVHTVWGPVSTTIQAKGDTLRQAILDIRKRYAAGLYDFVVNGRVKRTLGIL